MAVTFTLSDGTTTIDFAEATPDDFTLRANIGLGYLPKVAVPRGDGSIPDYITETIPVWIECTNHNDFATSMQNFHALQKRAVEYWVDPQQATPVWFNAKLDDEDGARRALVKSLGLEFETEFGGLYNDCPDLDTGRPATVVVVRHPYWEAPANRDLPQGGATGPAGIWDYTGAGTGGTPAAHDIVGDVGARLALCPFTPGAAGDSMDKIWMGIRSAGKHGTVTNFINEWECEDTDCVLGTDAALAADATANPGGAGNTKVTITPGTATWAKRLTMSLNDYSANETDNYGLLLWLLRTKVTVDEWEIQFRYGHLDMGDDDFIEGEIFEISNTSWDIYEADVQPYPLRNLHALPVSILTDTQDARFSIQIWARRTGAAGNLDLDVVFPIPLDEGYLISTNAGLGSPTEVGYFGTGANDESQCIESQASSFTNIMALSTHSFYLPPGDGRIFVVHARSSSSDITDVLTLSGSDAGKYVERWVSLRGSE